MIFRKNLYWGEHAIKHKAYIMKNLRDGNFQPATYLISEAKSPNLLEIHNSVFLLDKRIMKEDFEIIGIAYGYDDALKCVQKILCDNENLWRAEK